MNVDGQWHMFKLSVLIIKEAAGENKTAQGSIEPEAGKDTRHYSKKAYIGAESG